MWGCGSFWSRRSRSWMADHFLRCELFALGQTTTTHPAGDLLLHRLGLLGQGARQGPKVVPAAVRFSRQIGTLPSPHGRGGTPAGTSGTRVRTRMLATTL